MTLTPDQCLAAAWTALCPTRDPSAGFPRGFWPDLARVALEMYSQQTISPTLDFRPTTCSRGDYPTPAPTNKTRSPRAAAKSRAENTAKLLALLSTPKQEQTL